MPDPVTTDAPPLVIGEEHEDEAPIFDGGEQPTPEEGAGETPDEAPLQIGEEHDEEPTQEEEIQQEQYTAEQLRQMPPEDMEKLLAEEPPGGDHRSPVPWSLADMFRTQRNELRDDQPALQGRVDALAADNERMAYTVRAYDSWYNDMRPVVENAQAQATQLEGQVAALQADVAYKDALLGRIKEEHGIEIEDPAMKANALQEQRIRGLESQMQQGFNLLNQNFQQMQQQQKDQPGDDYQIALEQQNYMNQWNAIVTANPFLEPWESEVRTSYMNSPNVGDTVAQHAQKYLDLELRAQGSRNRQQPRTPKTVQGGTSPQPTVPKKPAPKNLKESRKRMMERLAARRRGEQ